MNIKIKICRELNKKEEIETYLEAAKEILDFLEENGCSKNYDCTLEVEI